MENKKQQNGTTEIDTVKTPQPPQHMDPSSPPGKGRNADTDKRELTKEKSDHKKSKR